MQQKFDLQVIDTCAIAKEKKGEKQSEIHKKAVARIANIYCAIYLF